MAIMDIAQTSTGDLASALKKFEILRRSHDRPSQDQETEWINQNWAQYHAYYKKIPTLRAVVDTKALWATANGYDVDDITSSFLIKIRGWGNDSFTTIMANLIRTMDIAGDAFAEIVKDDDGLLNIKPLDPSDIKIVVESNGIIKRYEQVTTGKKFTPDKIFHLSRNRLADEIHGVSLVEALEEALLWKMAAMTDWHEMLRKNVHPIITWTLATDDPGKRDAFKREVNAAFAKKGDHLYIPQDVVKHEVVSVAQNQVLNNLPWIELLDDEIYEISGVPRVIIGNAKTLTEAGGKLGYLTFETTIKAIQNYIDEQVLMQLGLVVKSIFPASLQNELLSDNAKDRQTGAFKPSEVPNGRF